MVSGTATKPLEKLVNRKKLLLFTITEYGFWRFFLEGRVENQNFVYNEKNGGDGCEFVFMPKVDEFCIEECDIDIPEITLELVPSEKQGVTKRITVYARSKEEFAKHGI